MSIYTLIDGTSRNGGQKRHELGWHSAQASPPPHSTHPNKPGITTTVDQAVTGLARLVFFGGLASALRT